MDDETKVEETTENHEEDTTQEQTGQEEETSKNDDIDVEELKKQAKLAENYKIRAEKAEKKLKDSEKNESTQERNEPSLTTKDTIYLAKADIADEDVDDVVEYAQKMGVSVKDAHEFFKPILAVRVEERKTAAATQTKAGQRGQTKVSDTKILEDAKAGREVDPEKLAEARINAKKGK